MKSNINKFLCLVKGSIYLGYIQFSKQSVEIRDLAPENRESFAPMVILLGYSSCVYNCIRNRFRVKMLNSIAFLEMEGGGISFK